MAGFHAAARRCCRPSANCCRARSRSRRRPAPRSRPRGPRSPASAAGWPRSAAPTACWSSPPEPIRKPLGEPAPDRGERYHGHPRRGTDGRPALGGGRAARPCRGRESRRPVDLMNRLLPFLPLLLALSVSSPFLARPRHRARRLPAQRLREMPRTGLPDLFDGPDAYARYVRVMTAAGAIEDASFLWWHLRPSIRFPTLELRIADSCPRVEDALAIAGLYRCLVRCAERRPALNAGIDGVVRALRPGEPVAGPARTGADGAGGRGRRRRPAVRRGAGRDPGPGRRGCRRARCADSLDHARSIARDGTASERQRAVFARARSAGAPKADALVAVVDDLAVLTEGRRAERGGGAPGRYRRRHPQRRPRWPSRHAASGPSGVLRLAGAPAGHLRTGLGEPRPMAGASNVHDDIVVNLVAELKTQTRGSGCRPFTGDGAVETRPGQIRRPDVGLDCGRRDPRATVAAEGAPDRRGAVADHTRLRHVREAGRVPCDARPRRDPDRGAQPAARVVWERSDEGSWSSRRVEELEAGIALPTVGVTLTTAAIYDGVSVPAAPRLVLGEDRGGEGLTAGLARAGRPWNFDSHNVRYGTKYARSVRDVIIRLRDSWSSRESSRRPPDVRSRSDGSVAICDPAPVGSVARGHVETLSGSIIGVEPTPRPIRRCPRAVARCSSSRTIRAPMP